MVGKNKNMCSRHKNSLKEQKSWFLSSNFTSTELEAWYFL